MDVPSHMHPWVAEMIAAEQTAAYEKARPFMLLLPYLRVVPDGNQWMVLFGADLAEGVAGFGDTPDAASRAFDVAWQTEKAPKAAKPLPQPPPSEEPSR